MKRIYEILMFAAVFAMLMACVSAADLVEHDFEGKCKVDIPGNISWIGDQVSFGEGIYGGGVNIRFFTNDDLNGKTLDDLIDSEKCDEVKTEGNLTIYKMSDKYAVLIHTDNDYLIVEDKNLDEAKAIALSAEFSQGSGKAANESNATNKSGEVSNASANATNASSASPSKNIELKSQDFYGYFKMDVPKDSNFGDIEDHDKRPVADSLHFLDEVNNVSIDYIDNEAFDDGVIKGTVDDLKQKGANVSVKDKLYVISGNGGNEVIFHEAPKTLIIASNQIDLDTLTDMASSIEITDK